MDEKLDLFHSTLEKLPPSKPNKIKWKWELKVIFIILTIEIEIPWKENHNGIK